MTEEIDRPEGGDRRDREAAYWTPHRVRLFSQAVQQSDFPAQVVRALEPALTGCRSALDVGAGVGALTVLLAKRLPRVTALEPSGPMLREIEARLARNRLHNVACLQTPWSRDAAPPHDLILVANVAPIFDDLLPFLAEAEPLARRAVALVQNVGPGSEKFYAGELYPLLLGRPYPKRQDYLRTVGLLHSLGIYANVRVIAYRFDQPFEEFADAVRFWTEHLRLETVEQEQRLTAFLEGRLERAGDRWIAPMRRQSAVIWWRTGGGEEGPE
jgi:SAM-dependent methyltransferase